MKVLNIEERTLCSELEKHYKDIEFKRKNKLEIRENIINFIKSKINEYGETLENKSHIQSLDLTLEFMSKHFGFECTGDISINNIAWIRPNFLKKYKNEIIACINPNYYNDNITPDCLKSPIKIKKSKDFIYLVGINLLLKKIHTNSYRYQNGNHEYILDSTKFANLINPYLNNPIPEHHLDIIDAPALRNKFLVILKSVSGMFNHNFFGRNGQLRMNANVRSMKENSDEIIDLITEPLLLEDREDELKKAIEIEERSVYRSTLAEHFKEKEEYLFVKFIVSNLNITKAYKENKI